MTALRAQVADGRKVGTRTRDDIIQALREYGALYGNDFPQSAFSPSQAKRNGRPDLVERYYAGRPDGSRWPSLNGIKMLFESWNAARAAAGFGPNSTGPASGRRKAGEAEPILHVRDRLVYVPNEKAMEATKRMHRALERAASAVARAERAEALVRELRARGRETVVRERVVRDPVVRTKTVTKTVKVKDTRALERARAKLADSEAARRAVEDQLRSERRDHDRALVRLNRTETEAAERAAEIAGAVRDRDRAVDRAVALEAVVARLKGEIGDAREQLLGVSEAAVAAEVVQHAERRAEQAEVRAARAEREMAEQAAAITGEHRRLTADELELLRARGPAGPKVMAAALKKLARARLETGGDLPAALMEVARAAVGWNDRLR